MKTVFTLLVGTAIVGASTVPPGSAGLQGSSERAIEGSDLVHADFGRSLDLDSGKHNPLIHHKDFSSLHAKKVSEFPTYDQLALESEQNALGDFGAAFYNENEITDSELYEVVTNDDVDLADLKQVQPYAVVVRHLEEISGGHVFNNDLHQDNEHPLISLMDIKPHSMQIMIKPRDFQPRIMVRILYERVRISKTAHLHHLDDPVTEVIPLYKDKQYFEIENLPKGKYIVCGEARIAGSLDPFQTNCFETLVDRLDNNRLQPGVIVLTSISILIVVGAILYAVFYNAHNKAKLRKSKRTCVAPEPCIHCKEAALE